MAGGCGGRNKADNVRYMERKKESAQLKTYTLHKLLRKAEQKSQHHVRKSISMGDNVADIKSCLK